LVYAIALFGGVNTETARDRLRGITDMLIGQTDLAAEAEQCRRFGSIGKHIDGLVVPQPVAVVGDTLIVFEYFDGIAAYDLPRSSPNQEKYAMTLFKFVVVSLLLHGTTHADLHAGNVLFNEETGTMAVIDFGLVYSAPPEAQKRLSEAIKAVVGDKPLCLSNVGAAVCAAVALEPSDVIDALGEEDRASLHRAIAALLDTVLQERGLGLARPWRFSQHVRESPGCADVHASEYGLQLWHAMAGMRAHALTLSGDDPATLVRLAERTLGELLHRDLLTTHVENEYGC
jgi:hypothetical protein